MAKLQNDVNRTDDQLHDICQRYKGFFEIKQKVIVNTFEKQFFLN